jgi:ABC-2 type transport system permease protein
MNHGILPTLPTFALSSWLPGWAGRSNRTGPIHFLFAIYSVVKPLSGAAILVVMYSVITGGDFESPIFPYIYLGNAFYIYVGQIMTGLSYAVIDDREHYKTLKYIYVAPIHFPTYLLGRAVARFLVATHFSGDHHPGWVFFLNLRIDLAGVDWIMFFTALEWGCLCWR